jgi:hypothetical protein
MSYYVARERLHLEVMAWNASMQLQQLQKKRMRR